MTINTHQFKTYTIDDHPDQQAVFEWIRENWHDLGDFHLQEAVNSLKAFADHFNLDLTYSISAVPDRSEFINLSTWGNISELSGYELQKYLDINYNMEKLLSDNCPFTGVCYDETLLDKMREFMLEPSDLTFQELIDDCASELLTVIHNETEYLYSDEALLEICQSNEYEFTAEGSIY